MGIQIGVTSLDGHSAPATGAVQSRESERSIGTELERGEDGEFAYFVPHKFYRKEVTISGVGDAELSGVTVGAITKGTLKIVSSAQQEYAGAMPKFRKRGVVLADLA